MRIGVPLTAALAALAIAGCKPTGAVGEKAGPDNKAFKDEEPGFFGSLFGAAKPKPAPPRPAVAGECRFSAWAAAAEPTAIRSGPGAGFAKLGTLPAARTTEAGLRGVEAATFEVVEARHGWFRIDKASYQRLDYDEDPVVYASGWIPGSAISFAVQSDYAYEMPDKASPVVASSWIDPRGVQTLHIEKPSFCQGEWVLLTVSGYDGKKQPAWLRGACGDLESTCDSVVSDNPAKPADLPTYNAPPPPPVEQSGGAKDKAGKGAVSAASTAAAGASARRQR